MGQSQQSRVRSALKSDRAARAMQELMIALEEQDVFVKGVDLEVQVSANTRPREEIGVFWGTIKAYVREIA